MVVPVYSAKYVGVPTDEIPKHQRLVNWSKSFSSVVYKYYCAHVKDLY